MPSLWDPAWGPIRWMDAAASGLAPVDRSYLEVPHRFRGPSASGNGGWTAGALAWVLTEHPARQPAVRVRLSAPPPLGTPMPLEVSGDRAVAVHDGAVVAEATVLGDVEAARALPPVPFVPLDVARAAGERYAGAHGHPFPECFACGPARGEGDGLRLRPGPVDLAGGPGVAAAWHLDEHVVTPMGLVPGPVLWAALDCPGGWSVDIVGRPMVLGTMTAQVFSTPGSDEWCVVVGRAVEAGERKALTATSLYSEQGDLLASAAHVWVAVDPATFGRDA